MKLALWIGVFALLLLAGAVELFWGISARLRQRSSMSQMDKHLPSTRAAALASDVPVLSSSKTENDGLPWDSLLRRADLPTGWRMMLSIVGIGLLLAFLAVKRMGTLWFAPLVLAIYVALVWFWLHQRGEKMRTKLQQQLPDFLDNMVRIASTGNSLPVAFQNATAQAISPLRPLLDTAVVYSRNGMDLDYALLKASAPYRIDTLEVLAQVLGISARIGGRADQALQRLSAFLRDLQQAQQELNATTSEVRASAWILGLLPPVSAFLVSLVNPKFFAPMFQETQGLKILALALLMEALGAFILYKLAKSI